MVLEHSGQMAFEDESNDIVIKGEIMKLKKLNNLLEKCFELPIDADEMEVDQTSLIVYKFFDKQNDKDYREEAIDFLVENKIDFNSNGNIDYNIAKRYIKIICPACGEEMKITMGGGNCSISNFDFSCHKCKTIAHISMPSEQGISFTFEAK
jgi:hypothetical protein